jgi:predicted ATPase/DNA-binding CsgD family transcriptional regulator
MQRYTNPVTTHRFSQFPVQMNETIGREHDITRVCALLQRSDIRLLTLTGPGGVGKTRLSLEIAQTMLSQFVDGVYFVSLAALSDANIVLPMLAQTLVIEEIAQQSLLKQVQTFLQRKQMLLVIDNFEHVLEAGPTLANLLTATPDVKFLVTSREILHLYGEYEFEVAPLTLPDLTTVAPTPEMLQSPAVKLFVERAQAAKGSFQLSDENYQAVAEICIQLDGLPLAIELAAARSKLLSPQALLTRLQHRLTTLIGGARDLPPRQQTLRNTLDWSYNLLTNAEQYFFRQLGIFTGPWTIEAAQKIHGYEIDDLQTLDILTSLVDKSLVRPLENEDAGEIRFVLLETIREYALECLERAQEQPIAQHHYVHYALSLVEQAEQHLYGEQQQTWLRTLDTDAPHFWAALRRVIDQRQSTLALRLTGALIRYLQLRSSFTEAHNWFKEVLALPVAETDVTLRARVLYGAGSLAQLQNELELAQHYLEECLRITDQQQDRRTRALARGTLALVSLQQGEYERAQEQAREGLYSLHEHDDHWCRGILHSICGQIASNTGNFRQAQVHHKLAIELLRRVGDLRSQAEVFVNIGDTMHQRGKLITARFLFQKGFALFQQLGDKWYQCICLHQLATIAREQGEYQQAQEQLNQCLEIAAMLGARRERVLALLGLGQVAFQQNNIVQALHYTRDSLHLAREIAYLPGMAYALLLLGDIAFIRTHYVDAQLHYEQSWNMIRQIGDRFAAIFAQCSLGLVALKQRKYEQAAIIIKQAMHQAFELDNTSGLSSTLTAFALLCGQQDLSERAVQFLGTAQALRDYDHIAIPPVFLAGYEQEIQRYKTHIGEAAFQENWSVGQNMSLHHTFGMIANLRLTSSITQITTAEKPAHATDIPPTYPASLTVREVDVLRLLASGLTDIRIAQKLTLSPRTVNTHLRSIYAKLGVSSRSAATRFAVEHDLV